MEWNAGPPLQWDWENLTVLNPRIFEHGGDILHPTNFQTKQGINFGSSNSAGDDRSTGGLCFELRRTSPKRSVSIKSSSVEKSSTTKFTLDGFEPTLEDIGNKKPFVEAEVAITYPTPETSACSCEPTLSLKLGKQAYFENACAGNHTRPTVFAMDSQTNRKRCQKIPSPHCQVEGCNIDLSNVKGYYRKHRVCENHSKTPRVIIEGVERRFCQQCSRFHGISEFDEKKRSCRRRLSNHNARRRKPLSKVIGLNPTRLSHWNFARQHIDNFSNKISLAHPANSAWESSFGSRQSQCGKYSLKPEQVCGSTGQLSGDGMCCVHAMPYHDTNKLEPFKGAAIKVLVAAQDLQRALSLLSTDLRGLYEAKLISPEGLNCLNQTTISESPMNVGIQSFPFASVEVSECWGNEHQVKSQMQIHHQNIDGNSLIQDFQLFKTPCEVGMFSNQLT